MGAHLSTIQNTLKERFQKCDVEGKGYLVSSACSRLGEQVYSTHPTLVVVS